MIDSYFRRLHESAMLASRKGRLTVTVGLDDLCESLNVIELMSTAAAEREMELTDERAAVAKLNRKTFYLQARLDRELGKITGVELGAILEGE